MARKNRVVYLLLRSASIDIMLKHKIMPDVEHLEYPPAEQLRSTASHLAGEGLGTVQMEAHGHIILVPTPSNDPNDRNYLPLAFSLISVLINPSALNWSRE